MGSILGPFIDIAPKPSALDDSSRDILDYAYKQIANDVRVKARARLDTGVDLNAAVRASNIKAEYEAGRIVIRTGEVSDEGEETKIGDLFHSNMEPPTVDRNKIVFREIQAKELERKNEETIRNIVKESISLRFPEYFSEGVKRIQSVKPELVK
jgi:hypothetical protein